jgi:hypothetical protein
MGHSIQFALGYHVQTINHISAAKKNNRISIAVYILGLLLMSVSVLINVVVTSSMFC